MFIEEFLHRLPPWIKVLMAGRTDVFQLGRLQVQGKVLKYGIKDLYFTCEDIAGYYTKNSIELTRAEQEAIAEKTEGWPLAVSMLLNFPSQEKTGIAESNMDLLFNYMASEILAGEEEGNQRFLTAVSVLEEITPEYCDLLLERKDSRKILASLHKKYFFLCSLAGKNETYRYHQLFRDFLLGQLGNERFELLEKAGTVACQAGELERAVEYFIAAGNQEKARETVIKAGRKLIGRGNWYTVERWLNGFSGEEIVSNPWLALYKAQIDVNRGRIYAGENRVNHALAAFLSTGGRLGLAESRLLKAKILRSQGRYQESLDLLELALPCLQGEEAEEAKERFDVCLEKSYVLMFCGRFAEAEKVLTEALQLAEQRGDTVLMAYFYEGLGTVNFAWGHYDRALYYCRRGMAISPDRSLRNHVFQDSVGPIYLDWGELDQAYEYLLQSVTAKENFGPAESLPSAYCQFGNVLLDRGELLQAEEYFRKALSIMENSGGDHFVRILSKLLLSMCLGAQGRLVEAQELVAEARSEAGDQSQYINGIFQVLECLFMLHTGNTEAAYSRLHEILPVLETVGARKLLCIAYSILALISVLQEEEKGILEFAGKAFKLAAEMNFVHDFLLSFEIYQPLLYAGLERGIEVQFLQKILVRLGERAIPLLQRLASHSHASVRLRAVSPLAQIGGRKAAEILSKLATDQEMQVSGQAGRLPQKPVIYPLVAGKSSHGGKEPIRLELMGPVRIFYGDREITHINWIRHKSRDLLVYLAHLGSPAD
ncbi:MAG TPA: tetratricopeptide repeat protein, partial [Bacillota bacterium]|nr:tetratricopeptide repeat protein [Bacillota bacterium]